MIQYKYSSTKAKAIILYLAKKLRDEDLKADNHKVFKIIYAADRRHLIDWGRPVLGDTYYKFNAGPAPTALYDEVKEVRDGENKKAGYSIIENCIIVPETAPDMDEFSETDIEYLDKSYEANKALPFSKLSRKFHKHAWNSVELHNPMKWEDIAVEAGADLDLIQTLQVLSESEHIHA